MDSGEDNRVLEGVRCGLAVVVDGDVVVVGVVVEGVVDPYGVVVVDP